MAKKTQRKVPVIEAKAVRAKAKALRKSKGALFPWEVWTISLHDGFYDHASCSNKTLKEAKARAAKLDPEACPVIVHVDIPPVEY